MTVQTAVRPTSDHVVVQRDVAEDVTPGGIVLPDDAKDKPARGKVIAVGPGRLDSVRSDGQRTPMEVTEGDTVFFKLYGGTELDIDGETVVVLRESDILLVM
jgi:chaperonin GroES